MKPKFKIGDQVYNLEDGWFGRLWIVREVLKTTFPLFPDEPSYEVETVLPGCFQHVPESWLASSVEDLSFWESISE